MPTLPGLVFLQAYPQSEIWRLFVDGAFWSKENGWKDYESREKGSLNAALESLCSNALLVNKTDPFRVSVELIKEIHKKCGKEVAELADKMPGKIRGGNPVSFGVAANRASIEGIKEFLCLNFLREQNAEFGPGQSGIMFQKLLLITFHKYLL